jgi:hypothetical protein
MDYNIPELIENGISDKFINELWSRGQYEVMEFWKEHATIPVAFASVMDEIYQGKLRYCPTFLLSIGASDEIMKQFNELIQDYEFFPKKTKEYIKMEETSVNGDKYDGIFNTQYGYFFGKNKLNERQSIIANILWSSMIMKKYNMTGVDIANNIIKQIDTNKIFDTFASCQAFNMGPLSVNWGSTYSNNGLILGCSKNIYSAIKKQERTMKTYMDISGTIFLIASMNILQSPYNITNKENIYHLSENFIKTL